MDKMIKQTILPVIISLLMVSCNEEAERFTLETPTDQMKIMASAEKVVLLSSEEAEDAITFSWDKAGDRGPDVEIVYQIRLGHAEMKELKSELIRLDDETFSMTWTVRELNKLLFAWGIAPEVEVPMEVEIFAVVEESPKYMKPEISTARFSVVGYDSANKLFIAILSGDQQRNLQMDMVDENIYNWKGELTDSEFWFVRNVEDGFPSYMKGDTESSLVYSTTGEGTRFKVEELGYYNITVDLNNLEASIDARPIHRLFLVTSKGGVETVTTLNEAEIGSDVFYMKDVFEAGTEFRFVRSEDVLWPAYAMGTDAKTLELKDDGGQMFNVSKTATYVMTVNMQYRSLIFLDVYESPSGSIAVVGDAVTDTNWDAVAALSKSKLTQKDLINRPEVISFTGNFGYKPDHLENRFKFVGKDDWTMGIYAQIADSNPFDESQQGATLDDNGDRKWQLPSTATQGVYTLELNLHTMRINFFKE